MTLPAPQQVKADLDRLLPLFESRYLLPFAQGEAANLALAMTYSLQAGGKRIRPVLCMLAAEAVGARAEAALPCAVALEYIHTYSLIHDDLPAMDDDDLRRGKPTCHVAFGEGPAILAGDGLLTEAFTVLASDADLPPSRRVEAIRVLGEAAGWRGMVGGQALDLEGEARTRGADPVSLAELQVIHRLKTGALLRASLELGAIAGAAAPEERAALREAGEALGLAFQIQDDILDATSTQEAMGKRVGKDEGKGKITYPLLLGLAGARNALREATERAQCQLLSLPNPHSLTALATYLAGRSA
ncbi:polyprenyl synthetase family protein [Geothrix sp. 21YS21S-2]|uniref:polyprenyl synthetase family protein n=1 Tax=Geothrix sp. 21YS21S-2 TaxID=3068893 RepID=UPI0027BA65D2|nr:farnesyl diphosphate synthase [Geothrix sp. 21YS21S-2]